MPWLYFNGDANTVCNTWSYKKRVTLNALLMRFVLAKYHMNGTFAGNNLLFFCFVFLDAVLNASVLSMCMTFKAYNVVISIPSFTSFLYDVLNWYMKTPLFILILGYENLDTQLSYCQRDEPFSDRGGGNSRSTGIDM